MRVQVGINYKALDQSDNTHIAELGKKHLQYLPKNSIVISQVRLFSPVFHCIMIIFHYIMKIPAQKKKIGEV
jgi:hypothetical protein